MKDIRMTSMERVLMTLGHKEPDKVPLFLLLSMQGAKELGLSLKDYYSKCSNVIVAQMRLKKKYKNDCLFPFYYAAIEIEAWGGSVIFIEDGPVTVGEPLIKNINEVGNLEAPQVKTSLALIKVLSTIEGLKAEAGNETPIIGVVMSPLSLAVMQLGLDKFFDILYEYPDIMEKLLQKNILFCKEWANAQLAAGATAICYFDTISSSSIIPREMYIKTGYGIAKNIFTQINGPIATHFGSGLCGPIIDKVIETGMSVIGVGGFDNLKVLKEQCRNKVTLLGNLNGVEMCRWKSEDAENAVKSVIKAAGKGGGLIISDGHGEIPFQVEDDILMAISESVERWGQYPLRWVE